MNYYSILGVKTDAAGEFIKASYRKLAKKYHPDANPGNEEAARRFKEVAEAYAVLGDADKRMEYDNEQRKAAKSQTADGKGKGTVKRPFAGRSETGFDFGNVSAGFESFFGFTPQNGRMNEDKRNPKEKSNTEPINVSGLFERYMGIKK